MTLQCISSRNCVVSAFFLFLSVHLVSSQEFYQYIPYGQQNTHHFESHQCKDPRETKCYNASSGWRPIRCTPDFSNAAYNILVESSNTCGDPPIEFCTQTGVTGAVKQCDYCNVRVTSQAHPPNYLTDFNLDNNLTWWQSETMKEGIGGKNQEVELILRLGKSFDVTYIRLKFHSPRPESFAIFKRTKGDSPWIPFQYYSGSCMDTYGVPESYFLPKSDRTKALCFSDFSDISPLTGGNVAFSTLDKRGIQSPSEFDESSLLQEFVTATEIKIVLNRLNTFGDEVFGDEKVLRSYYYAISDFAVGGRCKCNGHASECVLSTGLNGEQKRVCCCQHNTAGTDCDQCLPFYHDQPWRRATDSDAFECKQCNCNDRSQRCFFDRELYERTGHGGRCIDCEDNTDGPHCEKCKPNFYQRLDGKCVICNCNETGSRTQQCNNNGRCQCLPGVTGEKCDQCDVNHYRFTSQGCTPCGCELAGSARNLPNCHPINGDCQCKSNVEGKRCDRCRPGYFSLDPDNEFGCTPCFCYGHSSICSVERGFYRYNIETLFNNNVESWQAQTQRGEDVRLQFNPLVSNIAVSAPSHDRVYFLASPRYLKDQRFSYNKYLTFTLRINADSPRSDLDDIIIEGAGSTISQPIFGQGNSIPSTYNQEYKFVLNEHFDYGWNPRFSARDFIAILTNITAIKIRGTYTHQGIGFLDNVRLESAKQKVGTGLEANWVERCACPEGYLGQFCESCEAGYRHNPPNSGSFAKCVRCNCHGHADNCDTETGRCRCSHNTDGENCERCGRGYYGNARGGTPNDCRKCPCPVGGHCAQLPDLSVVCTDCPPGYAGRSCDLCTDGYYGDPQGVYGPSRDCEKCDCSGNIDQNAVGNCNRTTGECLRCVYNTAGRQCDRCRDGFYGNPLSFDKGDCKPCNCHQQGTSRSGFAPSLCDKADGQCYCLPHVRGLRCDRCEDTYYNLASGHGCELCNCDPRGSLNQTCEAITGQCQCRPGITGLKCDQCIAYHYGFSQDGCRDCDCDPVGSTGRQCDDSGQCACNNNVEGRRCERCKENKYNKAAGCIDCPPCYRLVLDAVVSHRSKLYDLRKLLESIAQNPDVINDLDFEKKLRDVMRNVDRLLTQAQSAGGDDKNLVRQLNDLRSRLDKVNGTAGSVWMGVKVSKIDSEFGVTNITEAEDTIERIRNAVDAAVRQLEVEGRRSYSEAQRRAEQADFQSVRMSEIARTARENADRQMVEAEDIENTAKQAHNVSAEAFKIAQNAIDKQETTSNLVDQLQREVSDTGELLEKTNRLASEAQTDAKNAYDDALGILSNANSLTVPEANVQDMIHQSREIQEKAKEMLAEAGENLANNQAILDDLVEQSKEANDLLEKGEEQQQIADGLLGDADSALTKARDAVALGEDTLHEANKTLETLRGFDKLVRDSEEKAKDALATIPEIERLISEAEGKTQDASRALRGADQNAQDAKRLAEEAQKIAEQGSSDAGLVKKESVEVKDKAGKLKDEADDLSRKVADTANRLQGYETQAENDRDLAKEAMDRANEAMNNAKETKDKVKDALDSVERIQAMLDKLESIDPRQLDDLERRLDEAERNMNTPDLGGKLKEIREAKLIQGQFMHDYEEEMIQLRKDVLNVQAIRETIPSKEERCYNRMRIEP